MSLPQLEELGEELASGNAGEAEAALVAHFEGRLDGIEDSLAEKFPHRSHLLLAAFKAHRRGEYELSIPVLFSQIDGIGKDATGHSMFASRDKRPATAAYVAKVEAGTFRAAVLSPMAQKQPINASEGERPEGFDALNRHMVLHGESLDYGNKTNSLRTISLINYLADVLDEQADKSPDAKGISPSGAAPS